MSMKERVVRCCAPLLRTRLGRDDAEALATAFKAIADPGRLRLLSYIAGQPGAGARGGTRLQRHASAPAWPAG